MGCSLLSATDIGGVHRRSKRCRPIKARRRYIPANSVSQILSAFVVMASLLVAAFAQNPVPQIVGPVKPMAVAPGSGGFTLTVYGANFVRGAVVNWNGQPRTTKFISRRELRAQILGADVVSP